MKALLIIDIQNDYFSGGKAELVNPEAALTNAVELRDLFRKNNFPIIYVQHINESEGAKFFIPDTDGVNIHAKLTPQAGEHLVIKHFPNSFHKTNLYEIIQQSQITELVVCGMMTHMCIDTTVRAAKDFGLPVTLVSDACATKDLEFDGTKVSAACVQMAFMSALSGMFAKVITTQQYIG